MPVSNAMIALFTHFVLLCGLNLTALY